MLQCSKVVALGSPAAASRGNALRRSWAHARILSQTFSLPDQLGRAFGSGPSSPDHPPMGLPLAKLRQVPPLLRAALKVRYITTCDQLLAAAARFEDRAALAHAARIDPDQLTDLVRQADLERVRG